MSDQITQKIINRWWVVVGALLIQISLGAVYIWSVFQSPLKETFMTWNESDVTCMKWFPDKRGLVTGLAVAGFGAGAFFFAPLANNTGNILQKTYAVGEYGTAFFVAGIICLIAAILICLTLKKPVPRLENYSYIEPKANITR